VARGNPFDFDKEEVPTVELAEAGDERRAGEKYCIECGAIIRKRAAICPKCGVSQSDIEGRKSKHCHECGAVIRGKAAVCPKCGVAQFGRGDYGDLGDSYEFQEAGTNRIAAGILAILLGCLGIHKFVLGYTGAGVIMLLVSILGGCLYGAGPVVMAVIGIVEGILYLTKTDREFYNTYVLHKREWF
jgi:RNA polymerase subunit RPABC4/transcription elongation factor Spt4/TM2 domain-containing membrane protein YozV